MRKQCRIEFGTGESFGSTSDSIVVLGDDWYTMIFDRNRSAESDCGHYWPWNWEVAVA